MNGAPSTGAVLAGRYRLTGRIGRGGMADVFSAADDVLHREVAVKVFRVDTSSGDDQRRVEAEQRTLAGLRHPGLVTVFDAGTVAGPEGDVTPFIVMELIAGPTLGQRLSSGALTVEQSARLGADLAATLAYVHAQGIVHRDIKPANVLLDVTPGEPDGFTAKLTDFGIALLVDSTRLTMVGMTIGTANYLSPEQATGAPTGPPSDVYSLGLVLLECLTGKVVYPGSGVESASARLHRQPVIPIELGPAWARLLDAMTARDPQSRPAAAEVARQLAELVGGTQPTATQHAPQSPTAATTVLAEIGREANSTRLLTSSRSARPARLVPHGVTRLWWVAAAVAVLVIVAIALVVNGSSSPSSTSGPPRSPAPAYPSVSGSLGDHVRQLEGIIG